MKDKVVRDRLNRIETQIMGLHVEYCPNCKHLVALVRSWDAYTCLTCGAKLEGGLVVKEEKKSAS